MISVWIPSVKEVLKLLNGREVCDCARPTDVRRWVESRYYYNPTEHIWLTYIQWIGPATT